MLNYYPQMKTQFVIQMYILTYFSHSHSVSDAEKIINEFRLYDIFFGTSDNSSDETYQNVAEIIKKCWECHLMRTYPDKKFIVEISGEYEQFGITFYQEP